jgi:hypothetical protein
VAFPMSMKNGVGDGTRTRDVQLGKLHDTLISTISSPLVLIREFQTLQSFRAYVRRSLNGMQMECNLRQSRAHRHGDIWRLAALKSAPAG